MVSSSTIKTKVLMGLKNVPAKTRLLNSGSQRRQLQYFPCLPPSTRILLQKVFQFSKTDFRNGVVLRHSQGYVPPLTSLKRTEEGREDGWNTSISFLSLFL